MELLKNDKVEENIVELEFKVPADEFETTISKVFRKANADITVPGFRKGKAPRSVVEKMYGAEMFFNDAIDELLPQAYEDAVKEAGLKVVARPEIEVTEVSKEDGFTVKAKLTTYPVVTIGEYKGLKAEKKAIEVTDEVIAGELENMQNRNARLVSVDDRAAQNGDIANIDFEGFVDGVAFEGGKGENFDLTLGSGQFIPGFEERVIGHNIGEEFDVNVTFPEPYQAEELAGKPAVFKTKINAIQVKDLPALDDEFAKDVSDFDTLDELKADIKAKKEKEADSAAELAVENDLVMQLVNGMSANIPEAMYETRVDDLTNEFIGRLNQQGLDMDTYLKYTDMTLDQFKKSYRDQAEQQVKIRLALEAVAARENIVATDEDFEAELKKLSDMYGYPIDQLKLMVPEEEVKADLAIQKAIDFVKENAEIANA